MYVNSIRGADGDIKNMTVRPITELYALINEDIYRVLPMTLYDTLPLTIANQTELHFFRRQTGQGGVTLFDTNNEIAGEVQISKAYMIQKASLAIITNTDEPFNVSGFGALTELLKRGILEIMENDRPIFQCPLWRLITVAAPINMNTDSLYAPIQLQLPRELFFRPAVKWSAQLSFRGAGIGLGQLGITVDLQLILEGILFEPSTQA